MRARTAVALGVVAALLFVSFAVYFAASSSILGSPDDFGISNTSWNGFSVFASTEHPIILRNISALPPDGAGYVLLEDGPSSPYTPAESARISSFVTSGGTLIVADGQDAIANSLLAGIGLTSRFSGGILTDPLFNFRNSFLVVAPTVSPSLNNVTSIDFNYGTTLTVSDPGASVLAYSSDFSYLYPTQPGGSIANAPHGPFPVLAEVPDGRGKVYLAADDSLFINSMIARGGNGNLLKDVSTGTMLLDTSHFSVNPATVVRNAEVSFYAVISLWEFKYSVVIVGLAGILAYRFSQQPSAGEEELKALLEEHPEWSEEKLRRLREETGAR